VHRARAVRVRESCSGGDENLIPVACERLHDHGIAREFCDAFMESAIERSGRSEVAGATDGIRLASKPVQLVERCRFEAPFSLPTRERGRRERLERRASLVHPAELLPRAEPGAHAPTSSDHQAIGLKPLQSFSHRSAAHGETLREARLADFARAVQIPGDDEIS